MKVLFHIDQPERWQMALGNAENLLAYGRQTGAALSVELVANGPAVASLRFEDAERLELLDRLTRLASQEVRVCACNNALRANGIPPQALCPFVTVVPAGVAELAQRQQEGWAYIKP